MRILSDNRRQIPFMRRRYPLSAAHVVNAPFCGHSSGLPCPGRTASMRPAAERQRILRRRVESSDVPRHPPMWGASTKRDARRLTSPASPEMREPLSLKNMSRSAARRRLPPARAGTPYPEPHRTQARPDLRPCSVTGPATRSDSPPVQPPKYRIGPPYPKAVPSRVVRMRHSHLRPHIIIFVSRPVWM